MSDIEEAISYIENTKKHLLHLGETWYADYLDDAIELLKEQEAVEPVKQVEQTEWTVCGNCRNHLISKWVFCPYCGRSVK